MSDEKHLGMGVMLKMLSGNQDSVEAFTKCIGKTIKSVVLTGDDLIFTFDDNTRMAISDEGQSCCEHRYIVCEDDLEAFAGAKLLDAGVKDAPNEEDEYGEHEVAFLEISTSSGSFQCATHNEHNGYYGGFCIRARMLT